VFRYLFNPQPSQPKPLAGSVPLGIHQHGVKPLEVGCHLEPPKSYKKKHQTQRYDWMSTWMSREGSGWING